MTTNQEDFASILKSMTKFHAACEFIAAQNCGHAMSFLRPGQCTPWSYEKEFRDQQRHLAEEVRHYKLVRNILTEVVGSKEAADREIGSILPPNKSSLLPAPISYIDHIVHMAIGDRAGRIQIEGIIGSAHEPYANAAQMMLKEEQRHEADALTKLIDWVRANPDLRLEISQAMERQIPVGLNCLGKPGSSGDAKALALGIKRRSSADAVRRYTDEVAECRGMLCL